MQNDFDLSEKCRMFAMTQTKSFYMQIKDGIFYAVI